MTGQSWKAGLALLMFIEIVLVVVLHEALYQSNFGATLPRAVFALEMFVFLPVVGPAFWRANQSINIALQSLSQPDFGPRIRTAIFITTGAAICSGLAGSGFLVLLRILQR